MRPVVPNIYIQKNLPRRSFECSVSGCASSFVHQRTLRRHETEKHGRKKRIRYTDMYNSLQLNSSDTSSVGAMNDQDNVTTHSESTPDNDTLNNLDNATGHSILHSSFQVESNSFDNSNEKLPQNDFPPNRAIDQVPNNQDDTTTVDSNNFSNFLQNSEEPVTRASNVETSIKTELQIIAESSQFYN